MSSRDRERAARHKAKRALGSVVVDRVTAGEGDMRASDRLESTCTPTPITSPIQAHPASLASTRNDERVCLSPRASRVLRRTLTGAYIAPERESIPAPSRPDAPSDAPMRRSTCSPGVERGTEWHATRLRLMERGDGRRELSPAAHDRELAGYADARATDAARDMMRAEAVQGVLVDMAREALGAEDGDTLRTVRGAFRGALRAERRERDALRAAEACIPQGAGERNCGGGYLALRDGKQGLHAARRVWSQEVEAFAGERETDRAIARALFRRAWPVA